MIRLVPAETRLPSVLPMAMPERDGGAEVGIVGGRPVAGAVVGRDGRVNRHRAWMRGINCSRTLRMDSPMLPVLDGLVT